MLKKYEIQQTRERKRFNKEMSKIEYYGRNAIPDCDRKYILAYIEHCRKAYRTEESVQANTLERIIIRLEKIVRGLK